MKRILRIVLIVLILIFGTGMGQAMAQCRTQALIPDGPDMCVSLGLTDSSGSLKHTFNLNEEIDAVLSLENVGTSDIYTSTGFRETDYRVRLQFTLTRPDGTEEIITGAPGGGMPDPPPPPRDPCAVSGEEAVQVEAIDTLPSTGDDSAWSPDPFNVLDFYGLNRAGRYRVKAIIPWRTYPETALKDCKGTPYAPITSADCANWNCELESNIVYLNITADTDGDGYTYPEAFGTDPLTADCDDGDPAVHPGATEILGNGKDDDCNPATPDVAAVDSGFILVRAAQHTVGTGDHPGSTKDSIDGMEVRAYDMSADSCVKSKFGVSWRYYPSIWGSCNPAQAVGSTGTDGTVTLALDPGDYVVIAQYPPEGGENVIYPGVSAGGVASGQTMEKYLQVIIKANGKKVPGKYKRLKGSDLLIIEPEYAEWSSDTELYPFVFDSVGDWTVTTSVTPPEGFVADNDALSAEVNNEVDAVQFTLTDVGSKWVSTKVTHKIKHKIKRNKYKEITIEDDIGIKLTPELAQEKGTSIYGNDQGEDQNDDQHDDQDEQPHGKGKGKKK